MKVRVICCNDAIEHVVVGSKKAAERRLKRMMEEHYRKVHDDYSSAEKYTSVHYWHVHTVLASIRPKFPEFLKQIVIAVVFTATVLTTCTGCSSIVQSESDVEEFGSIHGLITVCESDKFFVKAEDGGCYVRLY